MLCLWKTLWKTRPASVNTEPDNFEQNYGSENLPVENYEIFCKKNFIKYKNTDSVSDRIGIFCEELKNFMPRTFRVRVNLRHIR